MPSTHHGRVIRFVRRQALDGRARQRRACRRPPGARTGRRAGRRIGKRIRVRIVPVERRGEGRQRTTRRVRRRAPPSWGREDLVEELLESGMRDLLQAERRLAHLADAPAQRGDVLGAEIRVVAEGRLQLVERLGGDARVEDAVQPLERVMEAFEATHAFVDRKAWTHRLVDGAETGERRDVRGHTRDYSSDLRVEIVCNAAQPGAVNCRAEACSRCLLPNAAARPTPISPSRERDAASGLSLSHVEWMSERGARLARREERAYREYSSDEQRRRAGRPARQALYM